MKVPLYGKFSPVPNKIKKTTEIMNEDPVKHNDCFKIVVILDESGSMECIRDDMIKALNSLIKEQKEIKDRPCKFTLVKFNNEVTRLIKNLDLKEVSELSRKDYIPNSTTALYDAIGSTINWFRYESNVLMVIVTDGQENASKKYNYKEITQMLDEKQKYREWTYVYLSNDLSTAKQGDNLGLYKSSYSTNCVQDQNNYSNYISLHLNNAIKNHRMYGMSVQRQLNSMPCSKIKKIVTTTTWW